jgi:hypothetical protein
MTARCSRGPPRPLNGGDIRTLMDKALWARFGETVATAPHAIQWLSDNVLTAST